MAESESGQDKTEEPTEKKKKDAREKGEIARSKELNTLAVMLAGAGGLLIYGGGLAQDLLEVMRLNFSLPREVLLSPGAMGQYLLHSGKIAIIAVQPVLITLLLTGIQVGVRWLDRTQGDAGMLAGALTVIVWKQFGWLGLYEIIPGFVFATLAIVVFSLLDKAPSKAMLDRFDEAEREFQTPPDALGEPVAVN